MGLYIFVDDEFSDPVFADPEPDDADEDLYAAVCEAVNDAVEGDAPARGHRMMDDLCVGWLHQKRLGLSMAAAVEAEVGAAAVGAYLKALMDQYLEEVDNPRDPERSGVADVVVDVIPPWEDD